MIFLSWFIEFFSTILLCIVELYNGSEDLDHQSNATLINTRLESGHDQNRESNDSLDFVIWLILWLSQGKAFTSSFTLSSNLSLIHKNIYLIHTVQDDWLVSRIHMDPYGHVSFANISYRIVFEAMKRTRRNQKNGKLDIRRSGRKKYIQVLWHRIVLWKL